MAGEVVSSVAGSTLSGAGTGATIGSVIPGIGTAVGAGVGAVIGAISGFAKGKQAKGLEKAYKNAEKNVNPIDPAMQAYLARVRQQERQFRAGTDTSSAFAAQQARNVGAQTQANLARAGGPGMVGNLLRSQQALGSTIAGIGANAQQGANQALGIQGGILGNISERVYQRQRELRNQAMSRAAGARQDINNMLAGSIAMIPQIAGGFKGGGAPNMSGKTFDPLSATSPGVGSYFPGAYNAGDVATPSYQAPRNFSTPLSYQPQG